MKLAIVFEVPDESAAAYLNVCADIVQAFNQRQEFLKTGAGSEHPRSWSFDLAMRPVVAAMAETDRELVRLLDKELGQAT